MSAPRSCESCGQDSAGERRVKCSECDGPVHMDCRDVTGTCYRCRWRQARTLGIAWTMLAPVAAGRAPFAANPPATVGQGLPLPVEASEENPRGRSASEVRIMTAAVFAGWHIAERKDNGTVVLKKKNAGYLCLIFSVHGRALYAHTPKRHIPLTADSIITYLESK
ncbi:hypothetical protein ACWGQT_07300 [Streptomyces yangpuensis]